VELIGIIPPLALHQNTQPEVSMRRAFLAVFLTGLLSPAACMDADREDVPQVLEVVGSPAPEGEMPRGVYVVIPPEHATNPNLASESATPDVGIKYAGQVIIYMNKDGGTYTPGFNDSRTNRSSIPSTTSTISPWNVSQSGWDQVMSCMRDIWSPFNVVITDVDPGNTPHLESVVAGLPSDVGMPSGVGGVSPFTSDCSTIDNSIVYTFAEVYGSNYRAICETAAQEVAHSFGLDHEYLCEDPMTYLGGCGSKTFQNANAACGENGPRTCACGGSTQNSVQMLTNRVGPAQPVNPDVLITRPSEGQTVAPGFVVEASVDAALNIDKVEMFVDGSLVLSLVTPPWVFNAPETLAPGSHIVETRATDSNQNVGAAQVSVTVSDPADPDPDPDPNPDPDPDPDPSDPTASGDLVGGCSVGGGGDTGLALILLGLGLAVARRRR